MKIRIVAVRNLKGSAERELCAEYLARIARYCKVEEVVVKPDRPATEVRAIRKACEGAAMVLLDERGTTLTSQDFARRLSSLASQGKGVVALVIGGAHGLPAPLFDGARACERWSLSALTLPHRLARIVLCEQIYRALTILRGEPYHH